MFSLYGENSTHQNFKFNILLLSLFFFNKFFNSFYFFLLFFFNNLRYLKNVLHKHHSNPPPPCQKKKRKLLAPSSPLNAYIIFECPQVNLKITKYLIKQSGFIRFCCIIICLLQNGIKLKKLF